MRDMFRSWPGQGVRICLLSLVAVCLLTACSKREPRYVIGVSQCSADIWREKQNAELRMDTYFQDGVELRFASAYDSDERQIEQIDSLIASGIDLLIVAPNQVATISPAIDRAYDQGIPVIVFERKTNSKKYTAFMGADNHEMGRLMGEYIASRLNGHGKVLQIMGLKGSSPAIDRDKGFKEAISHYPQITLVATLQGDWTEQSAYDSQNLPAEPGSGVPADGLQQAGTQICDRRFPVFGRHLAREAECRTAHGHLLPRWRGTALCFSLRQ